MAEPAEGTEEALRSDGWIGIALSMALGLVLVSVVLLGAGLYVSALISAPIITLLTSGMLFLGLLLIAAAS